MRRCPADGGQAGYFPVAIGKMFVPIIQARVKQARQFFRLGIKARKICSLVQIAMMAGQREIFRRIFSAMLSGNNVLDVKPQRLKILMQPAILTTILCALPDGLTQAGIHQPALAKMRRALACRIPMSVLAWM